MFKKLKTKIKENKAKIQAKKQEWCKINQSRFGLKNYLNDFISQKFGNENIFVKTNGYKFYLDIPNKGNLSTLKLYLELTNLLTNLIDQECKYEVEVNRDYSQKGNDSFNLEIYWWLGPQYFLDNFDKWSKYSDIKDNSSNYLYNPIFPM